MKFELEKSSNKSKARAGILHTDHGSIETPIFMPVGTLGSVKGVHQRELKSDISAPVILGNTYHLYLRPGTEILKKSGGLHKFMNWNGAILTDSGGFQVYSLSKMRKIDEEGVRFQSHIDGSYHKFTPENVILTQREIGADIIMAFDECTPYPCDKGYAKKSLALTHEWMERCQTEFDRKGSYYQHEQSLFPIVQGSVYKDLRIQSAEFMSDYGDAGIAIGGLSVGEPHDLMYEMTNTVTDILPTSKARYLMGVGTPQNLIECIDRGIDMFDCVFPTRNARHGMLYTSNGIINIKNKKWSNDFSPVNEEPISFIDRDYSKAYIRHLIHSGERLGGQIASINNLAFYLWLMREARKAIIQGRWEDWKTQVIPRISRKL